MEPNKYSIGREPGGLDRLAAAVEELAVEDLTRLPTVRRPRGCWRCGGCWTGWKANGCASWPPWTAA
jgi:hypothetical protein